MTRRRTVVTSAALLAAVYAGLIRSWQLNWGATAHEAARPMAGDDVVTHPTVRATRAVTIRATREAIWPWLVQVGTGRAGWYSYDLIDNFGRRSASRIVPELQSLGVGDTVPLTPSGTKGFVVQDMQPPTSMVWTTAYDTTWAWQLESQEDGTTRLLSRVRFQLRPNPISVVVGLMMEFGDGIMMRKMLLNLRARAEGNVLLNQTP